MTTSLTIGVDDFTAAGVTPVSGGLFQFNAVTLDAYPGTGRLLTTAAWEVTLDATGSASTLIPDAAPGQGLRISSTVRGWNRVATVANYPTGPLTMSQLLAYEVNPASLVGTVNLPPAWVTALASTVRSVNGQAPDPTGDVVLGSTNGLVVEIPTPVSSYTITHNFGRLPSVATWVDGVLVDTDLSSTTTQTTISWPEPTAFTAVLT